MNEIDPHRCLAFLQAKAPEFAQKKAERIFLEERIKPIKSQIMNESTSASLGQREADAYADPRYTEHLKGYKQAIQEEEELKLLLSTAQAKLDTWKTLEYSKRQELKNLG